MLDKNRASKMRHEGRKEVDVCLRIQAKTGGETGEDEVEEGGGHRELTSKMISGRWELDSRDALTTTRTRATQRREMLVPKSRMQASEKGG